MKKLAKKLCKINTFIAVCMTSNGLKKQFVVVSLNKYLESILDWKVREMERGEIATPKCNPKDDFHSQYTLEILQALKLGIQLWRILLNQKKKFSSRMSIDLF